MTTEATNDDRVARELALRDAIAETYSYANAPGYDDIAKGMRLAGNGIRERLLRLLERATGDLPR